MSVGGSANTQAPDEVRPGLFLGGYYALAHVDSLGITHILSVVNGPVSRNMCAEIMGSSQDDYSAAGRPLTRHHVDLPDVETSNLLSHLPACIDFISQALQGGGKVLVHCAAGVSRSATTVTAYVMVSEGMDAELALKYVQMKHPPAWPNEGFRYQLKLFEDMGCKLDTEYPPYKRFLLMTMSHGSITSQAALPAPVSSDNQTLYRCRKCRTLLATSANIMDGAAGTEGLPADSRFGSRSNGTSGRPSSSASEDSGQRADASNLWVEPLRWMEGVLGEVQGKLVCPKCCARLGYFNWSGMQTSTGRWVTPAFQLIASRLDAEAPGGLAAMSGLRVAHPRRSVSSPRRSISSPRKSAAAPPASSPTAPGPEAAAQAACPSAGNVAALPSAPAGAVAGASAVDAAAAQPATPAIRQPAADGAQPDAQAGPSGGAAAAQAALAHDPDAAAARTPVSDSAQAAGCAHGMTEGLLKGEAQPSQKSKEAIQAQAMADAAEAAAASAAAARATHAKALAQAGGM